MSDDIVARLRAQIFSLEFEVERLKRGGCARDQRTTQWCDEARILRDQLDAAEASNKAKDRTIAELMESRKP